MKHKLGMGIIVRKGIRRKNNKKERKIRYHKSFFLLSFKVKELQQISAMVVEKCNKLRLY